MVVLYSLKGHYYPNNKIVKKGGGWVILLFLLLFGLSLQANARTRQSKPEVSLKQSAQHVWQRQQVLITLEVLTDDPFSRLEVEEFQQKGFSIRAFPLKRVEAKTTTRLILKWLVFPFMAGKQVLKLPEIVYRPNRGRKQKLSLEDIEIQVRKLPIYIPPTMAVGKIQLKSIWKNAWFINTQALTEWQIQVIGTNVAQQTMPPIKRQILSNKSLKIFPIQATSKVLQTESGIINQRTYKIPFKALENGKLNLPVVEVQYFEPESGKLQNTSITPPFVVALNQGLFWFLFLIAALISLFVFIKLLLLLINFSVKYYREKQAIKLLDKAKNYSQLRSAVIQLSVVEGWSDNLSLPKFLQVWEKKFGKAPRLEEKLEKLQRQYFSGGKRH